MLLVKEVSLHAWLGYPGCPPGMHLCVHEDFATDTLPQLCMPLWVTMVNLVCTVIGSIQHKPTYASCTACIGSVQPTTKQKSTSCE